MNGYSFHATHAPGSHRALASWDGGWIIVRCRLVCPSVEIASGIVQLFHHAAEGNWPTLVQPQFEIFEVRHSGDALELKVRAYFKRGVGLRKGILRRRRTEHELRLQPNSILTAMLMVLNGGELAYTQQYPPFDLTIEE